MDECRLTTLRLSVRFGARYGFVEVMRWVSGITTQYGICALKHSAGCVCQLFK